MPLKNTLCVFVFAARYRPPWLFRLEAGLVPPVLGGLPTIYLFRLEAGLVPPYLVENSAI